MADSTFPLSRNFTKHEMTRSYTAQRLGINNEPYPDAIYNLQRLCNEILQPLRDEWGKPIIIGSGYRCTTLNEVVGGVKNSDHKYGCAADIHAMGDDPRDNKQLFDLAVQMMKDGRLKNVKQIIDEYGYDWIHISLQDGRTDKRNQVLHIKNVTVHS